MRPLSGARTERASRAVEAGCSLISLDTQSLEPSEQWLLFDELLPIVAERELALELAPKIEGPGTALLEETLTGLRQYGLPLFLRRDPGGAEEAAEPPLRPG